LVLSQLRECIALVESALSELSPIRDELAAGRGDWRRRIAGNLLFTDEPLI
jgi:hypothetical protein